MRDNSCNIKLLVITQTLISKRLKKNIFLREAHKITCINLYTRMSVIKLCKIANYVTFLKFI